MWPEWSRSVSSGAADRYGSDEEEGSSDTQRRKRRTGERSVFDRFIGEFIYSKTWIALSTALYWWGFVCDVCRPQKLQLSTIFIVKSDTKRIDFVVFLWSIKVTAGMMWGLSVVMMSASDPGSGLHGQLVSADTPSPESHPQHWPSHSAPVHHPRPLRTCQTVSVLPWPNQSCEL